ncbi:MAG: universal stress protein [Halobaculum sp.]
MADHVLVPIDGSEESDAALEHALDEHPEASITLLHVVDVVSSFEYTYEDYFDFEAYESETKRARERGERVLAEAAELAADRGIEAETILESGRPARQILQTVDAEDVDHVVMGSRGRSGVGRVLFGSVAESVTRRATVPVTVVR